MTGPRTVQPPISDARIRRRTLLVLLIAAVAWWPIAFLPWLLDGLPDGSDVPESIGPTAVPLYGELLPTLYRGALVGGLLGGMAGLLLRSRPSRAVLATLGGVGLAATLTLAQSASAISVGANDTYLGEGVLVSGLFLFAIAVTLIGWAFAAVGIRGNGALGIAVAVLSGVLPSLCVALVFRFDHGLEDAGRWLSPLVLAIGLVLIGFHPYYRILLWPLAIAVAWLVGSTTTAVYYFSGCLRPNIEFGESLDATWTVYWQASGFDVRPVGNWVTAIVVAAVVAASLAVRAARRPPAATDTDDAEQPDTVAT